MYVQLISVVIVSTVFANFICCNEQQPQNNEYGLRHAIAKLRRWEVSSDHNLKPQESRHEFDWRTQKRIKKEEKPKNGRISTIPETVNADQIPEATHRQVERSVSPPEDSALNRPQPIPAERERSLPKDIEFNRPEEKPEETILDNPEIRPIRTVPSPNGNRRITRWQDRTDFI